MSRFLDKNIYGTICVLLLSAIFTTSFYGCISVDVAAPTLEVNDAELYEELTSQEYPQVLERWTRNLDIFVDLELRLSMSATYKSPEFKASYLDSYGERVGFGEDKKAAITRMDSRESEEFIEIFISVYTPRLEWNELDSSESIWKLYMGEGAGRVEPFEIEMLEASEPSLLAFFPYIDPWSRVYLLKFPRFAVNGSSPIGDDGSLRLSVKGVMGSGELVW
jgi:hypothetical protein